MMNFQYTGYYGFGWLGMMLGMVVFWGAIIWLIIWLALRDKRQQSSHLDILKRRYARGEITKKQYDEMKRELE